MGPDRHFGLYHLVFFVQFSDSTFMLGVIAFFATPDGIKWADVVYGNLMVYPMTLTLDLLEEPVYA